MNGETARRLVEINRRFYARHAASFSASRGRPWPGWERLLDFWPTPSGRPLTVLDVGCGNARFASFLAARREDPLSYLGLDLSGELLADARERLAGLPPRVSAEARECDVGEGRLDGLGERRFDAVVLFGVLHHLPGAELRRDLLRRLGELLEPGGVLALTLWRFDRQPRFAAKELGWEEYNRSAAEKIDLAELEAGDHLLTWGGDRSTPRYCHLTDQDEEHALVTASGLETRARFAADGPGGEDNVYLVLAPSAGAQEASASPSAN